MMHPQHSYSPTVTEWWGGRNPTIHVLDANMLNHSGYSQISWLLRISVASGNASCTSGAAAASADANGGGGFEGIGGSGGRGGEEWFAASL